MSRIGQYKHITVEMSLNLEGIAERLVSANFGVHNMLSAIVIAWKRDIQNPRPGQSRPPGKIYDFDIVAKIEKLLERGDF